MANGKNVIYVYADWINIFDELEESEAGRLIQHFFRYVNDKNPEAPDRLTKLLFEPIKATLKRDLKKYEEKSSKNRESALIRWDKNNANACERIKPNAKHADKDTDKDKDKGIDKEEAYSFDCFWDDYDKKDSRKKCEAKWKQIPEPQKAVIKEHVPKYVLSTPDAQYRKNPLTYLSGECWNDEIKTYKMKSIFAPVINTSYERWDGQKRWKGTTEIPHDAPPCPSNLAKWDTKQNKWIYSNF